ncbi:MAG: hypothetical protein NTX64_08315 [Elusimicrobia bacterium]|nr:hypothetical protein [Elusimicrobiota bacterium]
MIPLLIAALLLTPQARAEDAAAKPQSAVSDARKWLEHLREGLAESAVKKQRRRMSGEAPAADAKPAEPKGSSDAKPAAEPKPAEGRAN